MPVVTSDYFPTVLSMLGYKLSEEQARPYDGVDLVPLIEGKMAKRGKPIAFESRKQLALSDDRYKIYSKDGGKNFELYDLLDDRSETQDLAAEKPDVLNAMRRQLEAWRESCKASDAGEDYGG
jgi:arylsulfatase A-like enzyme